MHCWMGREEGEEQHTFLLQKEKPDCDSDRGEFFQEQFILVKLRHSDNAAKVIDIFVYLFLKGKLQS